MQRGTPKGGKGGGVTMAAGRGAGEGSMMGWERWGVPQVDLGPKCRYDGLPPYLHVVRSVLAHMLGQGRSLAGHPRCLQRGVMAITSCAHVFLAAALAAYGPMGIAQSMAVVYKQRRKRAAKVALYTATKEELGGHCFFAALWRGIGLQDPNLEQVRRLRKATAQLWLTDMEALRRVAGAADMSPWQYATAIAWDYWGGAPDLQQVATALRLSLAIRDRHGRVLWEMPKITEKSMESKIKESYDIELLLHDSHYSTLKAMRWTKSTNAERWALGILRRVTKGAITEEELFAEEKESEDMWNHTHAPELRGGAKEEWGALPSSMTGSRTRSRSREDYMAAWRDYRDLYIETSRGHVCVLCQSIIDRGHWDTEEAQRKTGVLAGDGNGAELALSSLM